MTFLLSPDEADGSRSNLGRDWSVLFLLHIAALAVLLQIAGGETGRALLRDNLNS